MSNIGKSICVLNEEGSYGKIAHDHVIKNCTECIIIDMKPRAVCTTNIDSHTHAHTYDCTFITFVPKSILKMLNICFCNLKVDIGQMQVPSRNYL